MASLIGSVPVAPIRRPRCTEEPEARTTRPTSCARRQRFLEKIRHNIVMRALWQELRYAVRVLAKSPVFAAVAILSLALGMGANTAIFTLLDQVLLRYLPVQSPEQLVLLKFTGADTGRLSSRDEGGLYYSYPMYRDLRDRNTVFSGALATRHVDLAVNWNGQTERNTGELVSGNYFEVLGVRPALGRLFQQADDLAPEANPVAVLSYSYWQRRLGGDHSV